MKENITVAGLIGLAAAGAKRYGIDLFKSLPYKEEKPFQSENLTSPSVEQPQIRPIVHTHFINQRHTSGRRRF